MLKKLNLKNIQYKFFDYPPLLVLIIISLLVHLGIFLSEILIYNLEPRVNYLKVDFSDALDMFITFLTGVYVVGYIGQIVSNNGKILELKLKAMENFEIHLDSIHKCCHMDIKNRNFNSYDQIRDSFRHGIGILVNVLQYIEKDKARILILKKLYAEYTELDYEIETSYSQNTIPDIRLIDWKIQNCFNSVLLCKMSIYN